MKGPLSVAATYDDSVRNKDDADTADIDESQPTVVRIASANEVRAAVSPNERPYFEADGTPTDPPTRVTAYTRYVAENEAAGTSIVLNEDGTSEVQASDNVTATDVENTNVTPTTTDIGLFAVRTGRD